MTVYAFGSAKGSPGVTTTMLALAATWPGEEPILVVDADPAGGDLAPWLELPIQPGLVSLAAAGRRGFDAQTLSQHLQPLPGSDRVELLCSPVAPQPVQAALASVRSSLVEVLADWPGMVLVDCGRLDIASQATELFVTADRQILLCRPRVSAVHHLQERIRTLGANRPVLLAVGEEPYSADELAETCGVTALGSVAFDLSAADTLGDGPAISPRSLERSGLIRTARSLAERLAQDHPVAAGQVGAPR